MNYILWLIFALFLFISIWFYFYFKRNKTLNWKANIIILIMGALLLGGTGWLLGIYASLNVMLLVGVIILAPYTTYFIIVINKWLEKKKI